MTKAQDDAIAEAKKQRLLQEVIKEREAREKAAKEEANRLAIEAALRKAKAEQEKKR